MSAAPVLARDQLPHWLPDGSELPVGYDMKRVARHSQRHISDVNVLNQPPLVNQVFSFFCLTWEMGGIKYPTNLLQ